MAKRTPEQQRNRRNSFGRLGAWFLQCLGSLPLMANRQLGALLGWVVTIFARRTLALCLANVQLCFPNLGRAQQVRLAKHSIIETAKTAAEIAAIWMQPYAKLKHLVSSQSNLSLLQEKFQQQRGVLLLVPHIGNWEFLGSILPQYCPFTAMYQPAASKIIEDIMVKGRKREGLKLAPANRQGVWQIFDTLKQGEVVGILPDQVPNEGAGAWSEFFGQPTLTMTLIYKLIQRTHCNVLMCVVWRVAEGFEIEFSEPDQNIFSDDQNISLLAMNRSIEACVNKWPEQYQWEYNRFKRKRLRAKTN